ncbi:MAG: rod shape-determining protein MreC [Bacteroidales bacterium]|jgi:rod shape-determining protein MreC
MLNLFRFLIKYLSVIVFLCLETLSVLLIINTDNYNSFKIGSSVSNISGSFFKKKNNIKNYFNLSSINKQLMEENALLLSKLSTYSALDQKKDTLNTFIISDTLKFVNISEIDNLNVNFVANDTLHIYQYYPATVVQNTVNKRNNYIIIDKGSEDEIKENMCVISSVGVVGVVLETSKNFASVLPMLHSRTKISAKLKNDNEFGIVEWNGLNPKYGNMREIPYHVNISIGDTIVTSGRSNIYPINIPIGTISDYSLSDGDGFYNINIEFFEDYRRLNNVYVIKNNYSTQIDSLVVNLY